MYNVNVLLVLGYIDKQLFGHQLRVLIMSMNLVVEKVIKWERLVWCDVKGSDQVLVFQEICKLW